MVSIGTVVHTLFYRLLLGIIFLCATPLFLIALFLPPHIRYKSNWLFYIINFFYWATLKASFIPVSFKGWDNIPDGKPVVFAGNHQSSGDIPLMGVLTKGKPQVWLATQDLMRGKILRWVIPRLAVMVDVSSQQKAMRSMINLVRIAQKSNADIMIFPEGGRYPDDKVHSFYGGFVTLAKTLKRPVVPVYISGANKVYPPKTFWIQQYPIRVTIGKPFEIQEGETDTAFKDRVYRWFVEQSEG